MPMHHLLWTMDDVHCCRINPCCGCAGTVIALIGTYLYTEMSKRHKPAPKKFISSDGQPAGPDLGSPGKGTTGGNTGGGI